ncbi:MAG: hypothetical protein IAE89_15910, partial [Anaerolineae bacterium]|nr:hypothetical protein [Anaerolineae bacterium]
MSRAPVANAVIKRHRLPRSYRVLLPAFVLLPAPIFLIAILIGRGFSTALFDPRFWLPLCVALIPAIYWWREGVDVLETGIVRRIHLPCYYAFADLKDWAFLSRDGVLVVWDQRGDKALECRQNLTDFPDLL